MTGPRPADEIRARPLLRARQLGDELRRLSASSWYTKPAESTTLNEAGNLLDVLLLFLREDVEHLAATKARLAEVEAERDEAQQKLAQLREHTLSNNPTFRELHDAAKAYVDIANAYHDVTGGRPLSTTIGYLIRAGYLVPAEPGMSESGEHVRMAQTVAQVRARLDAVRAVLDEREARPAFELEHLAVRGLLLSLRAALAESVPTEGGV